MDINESVVDNNYGFLVSEKRKKIWNIELDLIRQFISICQHYGLHYIASGGTLLGAIRHNGFIPWDDDVDIMMPRNDYERFLNIAQSNLPKYCFVQSNKTEKYYANGHAQIRNNNIFQFC